VVVGNWLKRLRVREQWGVRSVGVRSIAVAVLVDVERVVSSVESASSQETATQQDKHDDDHHQEHDEHVPVTPQPVQLTFFPAIAPTFISAGVVVSSFSELCRGRTMWPFTVDVVPSLHTEVIPGGRGSDLKGEKTHKFHGIGIVIFSRDKFHSLVVCSAKFFCL
jgi:hypothetical protein